MGTPHGQAETGGYMRLLERLLHVCGWALVGVVAFGIGAFFAGQLYRVLIGAGVPVSAETPTGQLLLGVVMYGCMAGVFIAIARYRRVPFSWREIGLVRLLEWKDIGLALVGVVAYLLLTYVGLQLASLVPGFDATQSQQVGLGPMYGTNRALAFLSLVVVSPMIEEIIFRGMLYGRMRRALLPWWVPALVVSAVFGVAHLQWNVGVDVFCLSIVLCSLREVTGSIWAGILVHMLKNAVAFFVMFGIWG